MRIIFYIAIVIICLGCLRDCEAESQEQEQELTWTDTQIVDAIYWAEGGTETNHPYGILTKYKVTTPRQACFNTVRNQRKRHAAHDCGKDFLTCLRDRYCPLNADNDPTNLNVNWLKNVKYFLGKN